MIQSTTRRASVVLTTGSLKRGGGQRQLVHLARLLDRDRYRLTLWLNSNEGPYLAHIPSDVRILSPPRAPRSLLGRAVAFRKFLRQENPDFVISTLVGMNLAALVANSTIPRARRPALIVDVMNNPASYRRTHVLLMRHLYPRADKVRVVCEALAPTIEASLGLAPEHLLVIPNAVDITHVQRQGQIPLEHPWLKDHTAHSISVCVARLVPQKGHSTLLAAFRIVLDHLPSSRLWIVGDGPLEASLRNLAEDLGIAHAVEFLGFQADPFRYVAQSKIFALASHWEGLASVLAEAMALGVPVVATRAPFGTDEIVQHEMTGLLSAVGDEHALAKQWIMLLSNEGLRDTMARRSLDRVSKHFSAEAAVGRFERLLETLG